MKYTWSDHTGMYEDANGQPCAADVVVDADVVTALESDLARLEAALGELLEAESAAMPAYEAGRAAQDAWADRLAAARNNARYLLSPSEAGRGS